MPSRQTICSLRTRSSAARAPASAGASAGCAAPLPPCGSAPRSGWPRPRAGPTPTNCGGAAFRVDIRCRCRCKCPGHVRSVPLHSCCGSPRDKLSPIAEGRKDPNREVLSLSLSAEGRLRDGGALGQNKARSERDQNESVLTDARGESRRSFRSNWILSLHPSLDPRQRDSRGAGWFSAPSACARVDQGVRPRPNPARVDAVRGGGRGQRRPAALPSELSSLG